MGQFRWVIVRFEGVAGFPGIGEDARLFRGPGESKRIARPGAKPKNLRSFWRRSMAPWPHQPCPHPDCGHQIRDLLAEMVPNADQASPEFRALLGQRPGGAITCPYCQKAVEYDVDGQSLVVSARSSLRYSRAKMEWRAGDYGSQKIPPDPTMTPERWIAEDRMMPGALRGYIYVEVDAP